MYVCMYVQIQVVASRKCVYVYVCMYMRMYVCMYGYVFMRVWCACLSGYVSVCMCVIRSAEHLLDDGVEVGVARGHSFAVGR